MHAITRRFALDHFIDAMHRRVFKIGEVDGDLSEIAGLQIHAHRFYVAKSAAGEADGFGNFVGDGNVGSVEIDVVGDQEFARSDDRNSGRGMQFGFADIGLALVIFLQFFAQAFELAAANIFEIDAIGASGGGFIEKDGDAIALPDFVADAASQARHSLPG